jgi:hypothetical protein
MGVFLQEFDMYIVDRKDAENPIADNLSRLENIYYDHIPVKRVNLVYRWVGVHASLTVRFYLVPLDCGHVRL